MQNKTVKQASKIQLPSDHLSPTQINMYWRCPMQYYFRYVCGYKNPPVVAMIEGGSHHFAFEDDNLFKIKTGKNRGAKHLASVFADDFNTKQKELPKNVWKCAGEKKDDVIRRGIAIQKTYSKDFAGFVLPKFAEKKVEFKVGEINVLGYIDVCGQIDDHGKRSGAWDYKITSKRKPQDEIDSSIALAHYGWASIDLLKLGKKMPTVGLITIRKQQCDITLQETVVTPERIKWYRSQVASVANAISLGAFPTRNPVGWECSAKFCGYFNKCRGKCK